MILTEWAGNGGTLTVKGASVLYAETECADTVLREHGQGNRESVWLESLDGLAVRTPCGDRDE